MEGYELPFTFAPFHNIKSGRCFNHQYHIPNHMQINVYPRFTNGRGAPWVGHPFFEWYMIRFVVMNGYLRTLVTM